MRVQIAQVTVRLQSFFSRRRAIETPLSKLNNLRRVLAVFQGYGYTAEQSARALSAHKSVKKALHFLGSLNQQAGESRWREVPFRCDKSHRCDRSLLCLSSSQCEFIEAPRHGRNRSSEQTFTSRESKWSTKVSTIRGGVERKKEKTHQTLSFFSKGNFIPSGWGTCFVQSPRAHWRSCSASTTTVIRLGGKYNKINVIGLYSDRCARLFRVGPVDSVRLLTYKRCAFVNFTKREDCEEAIRAFNVSNQKI